MKAKLWYNINAAKRANPLEAFFKNVLYYIYSPTRMFLVLFKYAAREEWGRINARIVLDYLNNFNKSAVFDSVFYICKPRLGR